MDLRIRIVNKDRRFGADDWYYGHIVRTPHGYRPALFTEDAVQVALKRAAKNPEDAPRLNLWQRLVNWWLR